MEDNLKEISLGMIERYSKRYSSLGYNVRTLGWGTKEQQAFRFLQTVDANINFQHKGILDIGCGFGDYYRFLQANTIPFSRYTGWDINPDLIKEARIQYAHGSNVEFEVNNLVELSTNTMPTIADIGVMLGLLNLNLKKNRVDNYEYSKLMIKNAFRLVKDVLVIDFLSTYKTPDYPEEDFVFYHDPNVMLDFAMSLSPNVVLKHNYAPIPQKEFMLFIFKQ